MNATIPPLILSKVYLDFWRRVQSTSSLSSLLSLANACGWLLLPMMTSLLEARGWSDLAPPPYMFPFPISYQTHFLAYFFPNKIGVFLPQSLCILLFCASATALTRSTLHFIVSGFFAFLVQAEMELVYPRPTLPFNLCSYFSLPLFSCDDLMIFFLLPFSFPGTDWSRITCVSRL